MMAQIHEGLGSCTVWGCVRRAVGVTDADCTGMTPQPRCAQHLGYVLLDDAPWSPLELHVTCVDSDEVAARERGLRFRIAELEDDLRQVAAWIGVEDEEEL